jgi:hypothetical protein
MTQGDSYPTRDTWTLYAHMLSQSDTYTRSYITMYRVQSFEDFGRLWQHCHPEYVGSPTYNVCVQKKPVASWSFFRNDAAPEWEHPANHRGSTATRRGQFAEKEAYALWEALVTACVLDTVPGTVVGIQVLRKGLRSAKLTMRFDVWMRADACTDDVLAWLEQHTKHKFSLVLRR